MSSKSIFSKFPSTFWIANTMEIMERMGWYGFYAVSTLYLTGDISKGGLGLSSTDRGVIQALATFFLYIFPAVFGALADRYGYKKTFIVSSICMVPSYLLLGIPTSFFGFLAVYILVAVGHGMFKPVVISTVAKTTNEETGTMGFGIFYMMVNIGGFIGPIVAGIVRGWDWKYVFYTSAGWLALMGVIALFFYKEPESEHTAKANEHQSIGEVFKGMVAVVGSGRFFLLVVGLMILLVLGTKWVPFDKVFLIALGWIVLNLIWDQVLPKADVKTAGSWLKQRMKIGEGRYMLYLLLMAGFWTSFNQIFMTLPEYIRDYVDTTDIIRSMEPLTAFFVSVAQSIGVDATTWGQALLEKGQIKPEYLINLNAFGIIFFQVLISYLARNLKPFTTIISGVVITVGSFLLYLVGASGWIIVSAILVFSVGEMLASPKSKEYAGRIAPPEKVGMYMGYFYWCIALGNLFGGLLSGVSYDYFGPNGIDRPNLMWILFAVLAAFTAVMLFFYNRWVTGGKRE
ncbi:MAG: hypothetical protein CSA81_03110 [Acidobacteria bacterium]|nr:MAG: hypothetical protein CSA81_03110 [Acidobacteriota bacterium]